MALLLDAFERLFSGKIYKHRVSTNGDKVVGFLYDDLLTLQRSPTLVHRIQQNEVVVNTTNRVTGRPGRRPDGTFGALVPGASTQHCPPYLVPRGPIAQLEIGTEIKIMATKMVAQVDRVIGDLENQSRILKSQNPSAIRIAIVGVNHAPVYTGREGTRSFVAKVPPVRESPTIIARVSARIVPFYDETLILPFSATNRRSFQFSWVSENQTRQEYNSILLRLSDAYERRF